ncbi:DUF6126 family protein [Streptomyces gamaensis]|uniref:DUF6126 family protein n=1 Tax=Streptomyces gamaensis TaxID=1763542 RepID=A0ABW0YYI7_9ACTN
MTTDDTQQRAAATARDRRRGAEDKNAYNNVGIRVLIYVLVGHLFAGFIWLLFYLGAHAK